MTITRITPNLMLQRTLSNLNSQQRRLFALQEQLATGQRVNVPSDDPLAARRAVEGRAEIAKNNQYITNIGMANLHMRETESSLTTMIDLLQRTNELTLQAANQVNGPIQLEQISQEINQILESMLAEANEMSNGRYIFGGTRTNTPPFEATRDAAGNILQVTFLGNSDHIFVEINEDTRVRISESGEVVFRPITPQSVDIFQMMIDIRENMRTNNRPALQSGLEQINGGINQMLVAIARTGSIQNRLDRTEDSLRVSSVQLEKTIANNVDADFAEVTLNLNMQLNAFQAALNAGARIIQPSLMDFIR